MIIKCPYCFLNDRNGDQKLIRPNLAQILPNGDISILRSMEALGNSFGEREQKSYTIIRTQEYSLICGNCNNVVVYKTLPKIPTISTVNILNAWGTMMAYYENSFIG